MAKKTPTPPEVRQDRRPDSPTFGAVAVKQDPGSPLGEWAHMTTRNGGGQSLPTEIEEWTVL